MSLYTNVVVALDLRKESKKIVEKAQALLANGGKMQLLHVIEPIETGLFAGAPFGAVIVDTDDIEKEAIKVKKEKLHEFGDKFGVVDKDLHLVVGKPAREIKQFAEESNADLIVIGTHGQHGWELLLGSTANGVLHGSPCDVLTVQMRVKNDD
ncbi:MAG: universal stress protein [Kangiellaceae bacterium]|nr:universal stress protein [Kangiellaceae bacterium]